MRVGTWNLENLFGPGGDAGPDSDEAYEVKLAALASTITGLDLDVLGVQEVGSPEALADLVGRLDGRWSSGLADPDGRGIRVGFVSRLPLGEVEQVDGFLDGLPPVQVDDDGGTVTALSRPDLRVRVETNGTAVDLVCCHFKSKLLTFPGGRFSTSDEDERARFATYALGRRAAEAAATRGLATRLLGGEGQQRAVVVLGDLNDTEYAATTAVLYGPGGSEIGTSGFDRPDQGDGARLWNLAPAIAGSIGDRPDDRGGDPASDHRPVTAELTV